MRDKKKLLKIAGISLGGLALTAALIFAGYMLWERAPEIEPGPVVLETESSPSICLTMTRTPLESVLALIILYSLCNMNGSAYTAVPRFSLTVTARSPRSA